VKRIEVPPTRKHRREGWVGRERADEASEAGEAAVAAVMLLWQMEERD